VFEERCASCSPVHRHLDFLPGSRWGMGAAPPFLSGLESGRTGVWVSSLADADERDITHVVFHLSSPGSGAQAPGLPYAHVDGGGSAAPAAYLQPGANARGASSSSDPWNVVLLLWLKRKPEAPSPGLVHQNEPSHKIDQVLHVISWFCGCAACRESRLGDVHIGIKS